MKKNIVQDSIRQFFISVLAFGAVILFASTVAAYSTWVGPTATAPGNNVDAPINVGSSAQEKTGQFSIDAPVLPGEKGCNGAKGYALTTDASGVVSCTQITAVYSQ